MDEENVRDDIVADEVRVELYVQFLYPGIILKGDAYTYDGDKIWDGNVPMTADLINSLILKKTQKIYYTKPKPKPGKVQSSAPMIEEKTLEKAVDITKELETAVEKKAILPEKAVNEIVDDFIGGVSRSEGTTLNLLELKEYDDYTYTHSINVCLVSILFAKKLSYNAKGLKVVGIGALLHDIGKMLVPKEILNKPGPLTNEEFAIMKKHPVYSYELVKSQSSFGSLIEKVVLLHHEKYTGKGYPFGIRGEQIGEVAQILSLSDVFDAITSERSYKLARPYWFALNEIKKDSGVSFVPRLAQTFIQDMPKYLTEEAIFPVGTFVLLNTGEVAEVVDYAFPQTLKPAVNVYINARKELVRYPVSINLQFDDTRYIESVFENPDMINKITQIKTKVDKKEREEKPAPVQRDISKEIPKDVSVDNIDKDILQQDESGLK
jgi:HD-GYP domain-containing protein (c-di-GMP phosphodiesterase class II)